MDTQNLGRLLLICGAALMALGLFFIFRDKIPGLSRLGRLPGDISLEKENVKIYFPLATSLLLSLVFSLLLWLFRGR